MVKSEVPIPPIEYLRFVKERLLIEGDPDYAEKQLKYMRNQFEYYGLRASHWLRIYRELYKDLGVYSGQELEHFCELCFDDEYREIQYLAIEMVQKQWKVHPKEHIELLEFLLLNKSWWDSVDWIAKLVGMHFQKYPELIKSITRKWMNSGNFWLQRVSIIFQLKYKSSTDVDLLFGYILEVADSKEFFLRKAAGWALRQHSRVDSVIVRKFVSENPQLSALTRKEALRLLD